MFASHSSHIIPVLAGPRLAVNQKNLLVCLCPQGPPFYIILKGLSACTLEPLRKDKQPSIRIKRPGPDQLPHQ